MARVSSFLHSKAAVLVLLALALGAQTPHTATVFHRLAGDVAGWQNILAWGHAGFYAVALEFATLLFVVRGNAKLSWTFAGVSFFANAAYYWHPGIAEVDIARALLISIALPACIAFYSHDVAEAQPLKVADVADVPDVAKPPKRKAKSTPAPVQDADLETMLDGIDVSGSDQAAYWHAAYIKTGNVTEADKATATQFGKSAYTIGRWRKAQNWQNA